VSDCGFGPGERLGRSNHFVGGNPSGGSLVLVGRPEGGQAISIATSVGDWKNDASVGAGCGNPRLQDPVLAPFGCDGRANRVRRGRGYGCAQDRSPYSRRAWEVCGCRDRPS
jgi:hypothetical protein